MSLRYRRRDRLSRPLCISVMGCTAEDATGCRQRWMGRRVYLLGGWGKRRDANSGNLLDEERDDWKPDLTVVKATVHFL